MAHRSLLSLKAPVFDDIRAASERIANFCVSTPLLESEALNAMVNGRLLLKAEVLQRTGSFKSRGAYNLMCQLDEADRKNGVVAYSSGNHAQAVAAAARQLNIPALIVMPQDAPQVKIDGTRAYGAEVVFYNRQTESREEIAQGFVQARGAIMVPPYDHPAIIAGQGTVGLELFHQAKAMGASLDAVLVPCSGGGLIAGCSLALKHLAPQVEVYAVEPEAYDDTALSLNARERILIHPNVETLCDSLALHQPGKLTFPINLELLDGALIVSDQEAGRAMALAFRHLKLVLEHGGAVALAAALAGKLDCKNKTLGLVLSGGNVDKAVFMSALSQHPDI